MVAFRCGVMSDILFRELFPSDANAVVDRLRGVGEFAVLRDDTWSIDEIRNWLTDEPQSCVGAFDGRQLVGFCLTHFHVATGKLHVENLFVQPTYRREHIGSRLFTRAVTEARARAPQAVRVVCLVKEDNATARAFFEANRLEPGETMTWFQLSIGREQ